MLFRIMLMSFLCINMAFATIPVNSILFVDIDKIFTQEKINKSDNEGTDEYSVTEYLNTSPFLEYRDYKNGLYDNLPDNEKPDFSENALIKKLTGAVKSVGSRHKASLVLLTSEATWLASAAIICVNPDFDITQEVIEELNKDYKSSK